MINYMPEIAKMLGVELDEEFEIVGYKNRNFKITECGIKKLEGGEWVSGSFIFEGLLTGECTIKRKPRKPMLGERYWNVSMNGTVDYYVWGGYRLDVCNYKLGNCYQTEREAEANRDKWVEFYKSDKVFYCEILGDWMNCWDDCENCDIWKERR